MPSDVDLLQQLYDRFNARDMEALLNAMDPNVEWANGMEGGHVHGREGVRSYWSRQWGMVNPHVEPVGFSAEPNGTTKVQVHQVVRDLKGTVLLDKMVGHVFRIERGFITRFDIEEP
jgi:SnoaL-like domain